MRTSRIDRLRRGRADRKRRAEERRSAVGPPPVLPVDVARFSDTGVWHCNLFGKPKVPAFVRDKLDFGG